MVDKGEKYFHEIIGARDGKIDIYSVAHTFGLTAGRYHAVKKILCAGKRGTKDEAQDLNEAITALQREIEILESKKTSSRYEYLSVEELDKLIEDNTGDVEKSEQEALQEKFLANIPKDYKKACEGVLKAAENLQQLGSKRICLVCENYDGGIICLKGAKVQEDNGELIPRFKCEEFKMKGKNE